MTRDFIKSCTVVPGGTNSKSCSSMDFFLNNNDSEDGKVFQMIKENYYSFCKKFKYFFQNQITLRNFCNSILV